MSRRQLIDRPGLTIPIAKPFLPLLHGNQHIKAYYGGRGGAKAIDVAELIPTPEGYTVLGDIQVGDTVFDEAGKPCKVTEIHDSNPDTAYRLHFSDGATIDCCGDHEWVTWTHAERKSLLRSPYDDTTRFPDNWPQWRRFTNVGRGDRSMYNDTGPKVRTTREILATAAYGPRNDANHCIPLCGALDLPDVDLPIDPYVLGYWLANGGTRDGNITCGSHDGSADYPHVTDQLALAGYDDYRPCLEDGSLWISPRLRDDLAVEGLRNNKHVPPQYMRASIRQRLALLRGLMDGDGTADSEKGAVSFSNTDVQLAAAVFELVVSLGQKPTWHERAATLYGVDHGTCYLVSWRPVRCPPFSLPRKADRVIELRTQALRPQHRMITGIDIIDPKPMRCLTVDGPNHMYLVGAHMIPTHNSWAFARGLIFKAMCEKHFILCTRQFQSSIADSVHRTISQQISHLGLDNHFIVEKKAIYAKLTGTTFIFKGVYHNPGEIKSLEGVSICWVEEGQAMTEESWQILMPTIFRQSNSELWCSFNPENETDATYRRMVLNPQPGSLVVKVSYRDNPWFPKLLEDQRQHMLRTDPDAYDWVWEGNLRSITNAAIFRGNFVVEAFETPNNVDRFYFGADWGFADDPACLIRCYIRDECLFVDHEAYGYHVEIDDLPALFAGGTALKTGTEYPGIPEACDWPIKADSARPETISYVHRRGFNIDAAEKWSGSVEDGIAHLKGFRKIIVHERCKQLATEMRLYQYKVDDKVDPPVILPKIVDKHNHGPDALRYALDGFIQARGGLAVWERLAS